MTDIHLDVYRDLEVLYLIENGVFKQYFTRSAYERALDRGIVFYSDERAFDLYGKDIIAHCGKLKVFFEDEIKNKKVLSREEVASFFAYAKKLCGDYGKMNIEYTDKAFSQQEEHLIIKRNLEGVAVLKDQIRAVMNVVLFESDGYVAQLFSILGRQFNLSPSVFGNLTQREILGLFEGITPDETVVMMRQTAFVESFDLDKFYEGRDAATIIHSFREEITSTDSVRGVIAHRGKVTGRVKIIPVDYGDLARTNAAEVAGFVGQRAPRGAAKSGGPARLG